MADNPPNSAQPPALSAVTRIELVLLGALLVGGLALRTLPVSGLAIEHFDEGVYASNLLFPENDYSYPARHLYAPPLLPSLIEWSILFGGGGHWVPMLPGIVLGTASIPLVWWLSRRWFGAPSAIAAACSLALNDYHIAFSRSALTDVPLIFFLMLAVGWLHRGLSRCSDGSVSLRACGFGGLAAGLAWATKYNGWLALAIAGSGAGAAALFRGFGGLGTESQNGAVKAKADASSPRLSALLSGLLVALVVAGAVWSPVLWGLQSHGGYGEVARNHRNYVNNWSDWLPAMRRHQVVQKHYAGPVTLVGVLIAPFFAAALMRAERSTGNDRGESANRENLVNGEERSPWNGEGGEARSNGVSQSGPTVAVVALTACLTSALVLDPVLVLLVWPLTDWIARLMAFSTAARNGRKATWSRWLGLWMCLAWILGLTLVTPLYRPYPRLLMPFCVVGWIGIGSAIVRLLHGTLAPRTLSIERPHRRRLVFVIGFLVCLLSVSQTVRKGFIGGASRTELADVANKALTAIRADSKDGPSLSGVRQIVYVFAEPGLLFHLATDDVLVGPVSDLAFARPSHQQSQKLPTYLVAGPHAFVSETFDREFKQVRDSLLPVANLRYRPSDFVLLDNVEPNQLSEARQQRVQVFRVTSKD